MTCITSWGRGGTLGVFSLWPLGRGGQAGARCARGELGACQCRMKGVAGRGGEGPQPRCDFSERKLWREWLGGEEPLRKSFPAAGPPWAGRAGPGAPALAGSHSVVVRAAWTGSPSGSCHPVAVLVSVQN